MQTARRAVIDVGTNSVKLLVAEVEGQFVQPLWEEGHQTRLGEGFYQARSLQPQAIAHTARAVAKFAEKARLYQAETIRVIATSAARDAVNQQELLDAVEKASGLSVEVISGEQEAELAYRGVTTDPAFAQQRLLIMDAGGGSTEFILGQGEQRLFQQSFPLGAVRLLEQIKPGDPPAESELRRCRAWLHDFVGQQVGPAMTLNHPALGRDGTRLVGTGGTATILARMECGQNNYDRVRIEATRLSAEALSRWVERLWSLPLAERRQIVGLPPERADVILMGAAIYEAALRELGFAEFSVSTRGLRFAAVMRPAPSQPANGEPSSRKALSPEPARKPCDLHGSAVNLDTEFTRDHGTKEDRSAPLG